MPPHCGRLCDGADRVREADGLARARHLFEVDLHPDFGAVGLVAERGEIAIIIAVATGAAVVREPDGAGRFRGTLQSLVVVLQVRHEVPLAKIDDAPGRRGECEPPARIAVLPGARRRQHAGIRGGIIVNGEGRFV